MLARSGISAKLLPAAFRRTLLVRRLVRSGLFDSSWYMSEYPDVEGSSLGTLEHYLEQGFCIGYKSNPFFDTRWYLERYADVRLSGVRFCIISCIDIRAAILAPISRPISISKAILMFAAMA
jgi:hypothetical protein